MNLESLLKFSADLMGPGAAHVATPRHNGVVTSHMKKLKGRTRPVFRSSEHIRADASPSDLASHHLYEEPSSTDVTIQQWRNKRVLEKARRRNMDPFEIGAQQERKVTGPCGCTLQLGDPVVVEGVGRGKIMERRDRMLTIGFDRGGKRRVDQKFVHLLKSARS